MRLVTEIFWILPELFLAAKDYIKKELIGPKLFDPKLTWLQASSRLSKFIHPRIAERFLGALSLIS